MKRALVSVSVLAAMLVGGGVVAAPVSADPPADSLRITIAGFAFHPNDARVVPGAEISVKNIDWRFFQEPHTLTAFNGAFDTGLVLGGIKTFTAPTKEGNYRYFCEVHPFMVGVLRVRDG